jgi:hypothetical protein
MGTWGTALYSNDSAADLRGEFAAIVRAPWDAERILKHLLEKYPSGKDPKDEEYTDVRLAIADLFWQYGIDHPPSFRVAGEIVERGADLDAKRALDMAEADLRKRAKILEALRAKWKAPNPKPRPRRMLTGPEPFLLEAGDCLVYPLLEGGEPINPYVSMKGRGAYDALYKSKRSGWGTVLVLATFRRFDVFARYLVAILDSACADKPRLKQFRTLNILHANRGEGTPAMMRVHCVHTGAGQLKRMEVEIAGRLPVNASRVAAEFDVDKLPITYGENDFCDVAGVTLDALGNTAIASPVARYLV